MEAKKLDKVWVWRLGKPMKVKITSVSDPEDFLFCEDSTGGVCYYSSDSIFPTAKEAVRNHIKKIKVNFNDQKQSFKAEMAACMKMLGK